MKFKESKSIYLQIADRINDEILQGQYAEEGRIPSVREYAATVEVNANTVVRTYDYLQGQEIIYNKRGIGYFVSAGAKDRIITLRKDIFLHEELPEFFRQVSALDIPIKEIEKMYKEYLTQHIYGTMQTWHRLNKEIPAEWRSSGFLVFVHLFAIKIVVQYNHSVAARRISGLMDRILSLG